VCRVFAAKSQRSRPRADITATVVTRRREWTCRRMEAHGIHDLSETINALATAYEFIPANSA
jgi:hypothetical protein